MTYSEYKQDVWEECKKNCMYDTHPEWIEEAFQEYIKRGEMERTYKEKYKVKETAAWIILNA